MNPVDDKSMNVSRYVNALKYLTISVFKYRRIVRPAFPRTVQIQRINFNLKIINQFNLNSNALSPDQYRNSR